MRMLRLAAVAVLYATPAAAQQGLLPAVGADVRPGDLRAEFERAYQTQPRITTPGFTFTPSLEAQAAYTDGLTDRRGRQVSDFYTALIPGLAVTADTRRLKGSLFLAPELRVYATQGRQNTINNNLAGNARASVIDDVLFIDFRAFASTQSRNGGQSPTGTVSLSQQDQVQTQSYSAIPTFRQRFGSIGVAEASYGLTRTMIDGDNRQVSAFGTASTNQSTTTIDARASFTTGDDFGRFNATAVARFSDSTGTGALAGSHRYTQIVDMGYAVTRTVKALAALGHEDITYGGSQRYRNDGAVYTGGAEWAPDPDTVISAQYGRRDGSTGLFFDGTYALSARIRLSGRYSEGVGAEQEDLQNTLATASFNPGGVAVDQRTGIPLSVTNNFFGTQGNIYRTKRYSGSASLLGERNVYTVTVRRDERTLVSQGNFSATGIRAPSTNVGTFVSLAVQRDLSETVTANLFGQYGTREAAGAGNQDSVAASASVTWRLSPTLSSNALYSYNSTQYSVLSQQSRTQNLVLVSLRKTF